MNNKIQEQVLKDVLENVSAPKDTEIKLNNLIEKAIQRTIELMENQCFEEKIIMEDLIKKGEKADFRKMIQEFLKEQMTMDAKAVLNELLAKLGDNNSQQGKKNEKGFSYQNHLEARIKAGADNRKENMPVDEENHLVDTNDEVKK